MKLESQPFQKAYRFAFDEIFLSWKSDLDCMFLIGTGDSVSRSLCILLMDGIRTMAKFHSFGANPRDDVEKFADSYFPSEYRWRFRKVYRLYEEGLLYHFNETDAAGTLRIHFLRKKDPGPEVSAFEESKEGELFVYVKRLYSDFVWAVEKFKTRLTGYEATAYRSTFYRNYEKIKGARKDFW